MKLNYTFALMSWLMLPMAVFAQINLGFFPAVDDTIFMSSANSNISISAGGDGVGQSWDFSQFIGTDLDTVVFQDPVSAGYGLDFPTADVFQNEEVVQESFGLPVFYDVSATAAFEVGQILNNPGTPLVLSLEEPLLFLPIPSSLGTSFKDTSAMNATIQGSLVGIPADSVRFERIIYRTDTISASGSLQLSSGYYPNVLRKTTTDYWVDSIYTFNVGTGWEFFQADDREVITYRWIDPSQPFSLAELREEEDQIRGFRSRPFDPGPISYYLEFVGMTPTLVEGEIYPEFTVNIRNVSNNLIASGYSTDSIRVSAAGYINGRTAEWAVGGTATFDSIFTYNGGSARFVAYGFECLSDTYDVYISSIPDSLVFVGLNSTVNRTETVPQFEVHAYNFPQDGPAQLNTEYQGVVNIGKKSGAGAIGGTVSKPLVNGVATFNDISFQYSDNYELIAYFIDVASPDTASITVLPDETGDWYLTRIDTLSEYLDRADWFSWWGNSFGFNGGPSRIPIWTDIGQQFDFDGSGRITEIALHAGFYNNVGSDEDSIAVSFYDAGVNQLVGVVENPNAPASVFYVDSLAKHLLGTTYIREDSLQDVSTSELFNQHPIRWALQEPIEVHGPFVVTIQFNYENGVNDTLVIQQSEVGNGLDEGRNSRKVINNQNGFSDGTWLPEYMALASTEHDYDFMIEPILEVDSFQTSPPVGVSVSGPNSKIQVYPNPASSITNILGISMIDVSTITLRDAYGRIIEEGYRVRPNYDKISLDVTGLASGCYVLELLSSDERYTVRIVKSK